jgi:general secretion pathway protein K
VNKILHSERGIALVLVILMISIIVAVTLQLNRSSRSDVYEAVNLSDGLKLHYIAKSGFNGGQVVLIADTNSFNTLNENWETKMELISAKWESMFPNTSLKINIEDESGKIQINKLITDNNYNPDIRNLLIRLLSLSEFKLNQNKIDEIVDSIKDWMDGDDKVTGAGVESVYYMGMETPYKAKNGPLDCIDELLMVKGMTRELLYGTKETLGLMHYLTIQGDGKININTTPKLMLKALSTGITDDMADRMDEYRKKEGADLSDLMWYKKISGAEDIRIEERLITTKSDYFKITSRGKLGNMTGQVTGVVRRDKDKKTTMLLSWKVE